MNIVQLQARLGDFTKDQLINEMKQPSGTAPPYLVMAEFQRRKRMEDSYKAQANPQEQKSVAEEMVATAGAPQGGISQIAKAMAPQTDMTNNTAAQSPTPTTRMAEGSRGPIGSVSADLNDYIPLPDHVANDPAFATMAKRRNMSGNAYWNSMDPRAQRQEILRTRDKDTPTNSVFNDLPDQGELDARYREDQYQGRNLRPAPTAGGLGAMLPTPVSSVNRVESPTPLPSAGIMGTPPLPGAAPAGMPPVTAPVTPIPSGQMFSPAVMEMLNQGSEGSLEGSPMLEGSRAQGAEDVVAAEPFATAATQDFDEYLPGAGFVARTEGGGGNTYSGLDGLAPGTSPRPEPRPNVVEPAPDLTPDDPAATQPSGATGGGGSGSGSVTSALAQMGEPDNDEIEREYARDKWFALARAGFAMLSSTDPRLGVNIGEGGQAGLDALAQARGTRDEARARADEKLMAERALAAQIAASRRGGGSAKAGSSMDPKDWIDHIKNITAEIREIENSVPMEGVPSPNQIARANQLQAELDYAQQALRALTGGPVAGIPRDSNNGITQTPSARSS